MRRTTASLLILLLLLAGCTTEDPASRTAAQGGDPASPGAASADPGDGSGEVRRQLRPFDSCDDLLAYYQGQALELVGPYGLGGGMPFGIEEAAAADSTGGAEGAATAPAPVAAEAGVADQGRAVSGTNTQEQGVDEPDIVKTDGDIIVTSAAGPVQVIDVASTAVVATIALPVESHGAELLLQGDTLLVLAPESTGFQPLPAADLVPAYGPARTVLTRVDLTDPAAPVVESSLRIEGSYRSARMVGGTARIVMVSDPPGLAFTQPADASLQAEAEAEERNRQIIRDSDLDDWIPHVQPLGADGSTAGPVEPLLDCGALHQPPTSAGLSTLSVVTVDLAGEGLAPTSSAGLVAAGDTVYASTDRLVVATSPWGPWVQPFVDRLGTPDADELGTHLHTFDISDPAATRYVASGRVDGTLVNQFALSEIGGIIRVATTTGPAWFGGGAPGEESQSSLVVLREEGEALAEVGRVDGLGLTERIYAVRYLGPDVAAIVTFRQTDPLYLVDTSDPANPRVAGELKIPGFSTYLHPVADGWLVGIGQDADEETGQTLGLQASLFDIRDLAAPTRAAQLTFGEGYSPVEHDHRAFLHWAPTGQVVLPAELFPPYDPAAEEAGRPHGPSLVGAIVLSVGGFDGTGALEEVGRVQNRELAPGEWGPGILRSLVIDDQLWTLGPESLARHGLADLQRTAVVPLG